jgi:hypothetical protein
MLFKELIPEIWNVVLLIVKGASACRYYWALKG